jgi:hypothetical protein
LCFTLGFMEKDKLVKPISIINKVTRPDHSGHDLLVESPAIILRMRPGTDEVVLAVLT